MFLKQLIKKDDNDGKLLHCFQWLTAPRKYFHLQRIYYLIYVIHSVKYVSIAPNTRSIWIPAGEVSCSCIWISAGGLMYIFPQCNSLKIPGGLFLKKLSTPHFPKFGENDIYIKTFSPTITWILVLKKNNIIFQTPCIKLPQLGIQSVTNWTDKLK